MKDFEEISDWFVAIGPETMQHAVDIWVAGRLRDAGLCHCFFTFSEHTGNVPILAAIYLTQALYFTCIKIKQCYTTRRHGPYCWVSFFTNEAA